MAGLHDYPVDWDTMIYVLVADRLGSELGLKFGAVGAAFAYWWEPLLKGGAPPQRFTMGAVQKNQTTSACNRL